MKKIKHKSRKKKILFVTRESDRKESFLSVENIWMCLRVENFLVF
jgi:hypothetical protein